MEPRPGMKRWQERRWNLWAGALTLNMASGGVSLPLIRSKWAVSQTRKRILTVVPKHMARKLQEYECQ